LQTWIQSSCNVEYFVVIFVLARTLPGDVRATLFFSVLCVTGQTAETAMHVYLLCRNIESYRRRVLALKVRMVSGGGWPEVWPKVIGRPSLYELVINGPLSVGCSS